MLSAAAEHRGGRDGRRAAGAYFTAPDVCTHLVRRAIGLRMAIELGECRRPLEAALDSGRTDPLATSIALLRRLAARDVRAARGYVARARRVLPTLTVLDPTCGAGAFLMAAWHELRRWQSGLAELAHELATPVDEPSPAAVRPCQLLGIDIDPGAVQACAAALELVGAGPAGPGGPCVVVGDVVADGVHAALPRAVAGGIDVLVGNPPFVRSRQADAPCGIVTAPCGNLAAWTVERALASCAADAGIGVVLPVSVAATDAFASLRQLLEQRLACAWTSHFDAIPATLFPGTVQRITLIAGRVASPSGDSMPDAGQWRTSAYHRWTAAERPGLLDRVEHVSMPLTRPRGRWPKLGSQVEAGILDQLSRHPAAGRLRAPGAGPVAARILYKRRWSYYLLFLDFDPPIYDAAGTRRAASELHAWHAVDRPAARLLLAAFSSSLFWWWFSVVTDNRNVNRADLEAFPVPELPAAALDRVSALADELMLVLRRSAELRTCTYASVGTVQNTYFRQGAARDVIDRIDGELAMHVGLDGTQLEFIRTFERRFRAPWRAVGALPGDAEGQPSRALAMS